MKGSQTFPTNNYALRVNYNLFLNPPLTLQPVLMDQVFLFDPGGDGHATQAGRKAVRY